MAKAKIEDFGGMMPSRSARALPTSAAQVNQNLYLALPEFRPLAAAQTVASCPAGTKTLHRFARDTSGNFTSNPAINWITATDERNYVKGQINDERTERTYVFYNDGSARPRTVDVNGSDRLLGVPRPNKPTTSLVAGAEFTFEEAEAFLYGDVVKAIQQAIIAATPDPASVEPTSRFSGSTILGGPYNKQSLIFPTAAPGALTSNHWSLYAAVDPASGVGALVDKTRLGAYQATAGATIYIPLVALPYTRIPNSTTLATGLGNIEWPADAGAKAGTPVFTAPEITELSTKITAYLSPTRFAKSERDDLERVVYALHLLLTTYTGTAGTSRPTAPTKPTGPEYAVDGGGDYVRTSAWVTYDAAYQTYLVNLENWNKAQGTLSSEAVKFNDAVYVLQQDAILLTKAIENKVGTEWVAMADSTSELVNYLSNSGGTATYITADPDRIIEERFYIATFVTDWGEESEPSEPSDILELDQNDSATIARPTNTGPDTYAQRNITKWRLYRSNSGTQQAAFRFVDEIAITTATFTDSKKSTELGETCPTTTWSEPPYRMDADFEGFPKPVSGTNPFLRGGVALANGGMAAFYDNTVAFCQNYYPYAWPVEYQQTTEHPIVALGVFGTTLVVATTGNPYVMYGNDASTITPERLGEAQSCVSARSLVSASGGVIYASPDGLCLINQNGLKLITEDLYTREDWQQLNPSATFAVEHEQIYYLFHATGCLTFDSRSSKLGKLDVVATAAYVDKVNDVLYIASGTNIQAVFGGATRRTGLWKSGRVVMPFQSTFAWFQIMGDQSEANPVTFRWYGDGVLVHSVTVTNILPDRLPPGRWLEHEIEIESTARVTRITLASSTEELKSV